MKKKLTLEANSMWEDILFQNGGHPKEVFEQILESLQKMDSKQIGAVIYNTDKIFLNVNFVSRLNQQQLKTYGIDRLIKNDKLNLKVSII